MYIMIKRILDFVISLTFFILLLPVFGIISISIMIDSRGPVIFTHKRIGLHGNPFEIYKFRTMKMDTPDCATGELENPEQYITKVGRFLRRSSLDELPQLINVIRGDMSLVGPRPVIAAEKKLDQERLKRNVYSVRPGITGLAQIRGRDEVSVVQKARYDAVYVKKLSLKLDLYILLKTVKSVVCHEGIVEGKQKIALPDVKQKRNRVASNSAVQTISKQRAS